MLCNRNEIGQWHRQQKEAFELFSFLYPYAEKPSNVKTDFMPLMCFRKKTNLRRSPSMKSSDSFSAKKMSVARVCFWCMKSSLCPTAQQFLSQISHGFPLSFYVHTCCLSAPEIHSLLSLLICWLKSSFFSTSGSLVLSYNTSFCAIVGANGGTVKWQYQK